MTNGLTREERLNTSHNGLTVNDVLQGSSTLIDDLIGVLSFGQTVGYFQSDMPTVFTKALLNEVIERENDRREVNQKEVTDA